MEDNIWWKIRRWWRWEAKYTYRNTKEGIKNIFRWFPIVWKDRDWDTHYIWEVFKFKLKNQAKYIGNRNIHTSAKRDAEIMTLCVKLMDKIQNEYYSSEYTDFQNSEFNFIPIPNSENYEMKSKVLHEDFDSYFAKYPRIHKQVMEMENPPFRNNEKMGIAINIAHINHKRAKKLLFNIMEENIEKWWD
jgi:hypothetical protein